jgi:hypothetical protein
VFDGRLMMREMRHRVMAGLLRKRMLLRYMFWSCGLLRPRRGPLRH